MTLLKIKLLLLNTTTPHFTSILLHKINALQRSNSAGHYLSCGNTVDKADLLETFLTHGETDLPTLIDNLMNHIEWLADLVHLILHIHVHVATESCNLSTRAVFLSEEEYFISYPVGGLILVCLVKHTK